MLQEFVDREREMEFLEKLYQQKGFKSVALYGRRRVGKTELIKKFLQNKESCYILCTNENIKENIDYMKDGFSRMLHRPYFNDLKAVGLYELFKHLQNEVSDEKYVVAIDEFPFLLEIERGILSKFQKVIDEILQDTNLMLILCGSSLSMMENDVLGYRSPLYGRRLNAWKMQPFSLKTMLQMFGNINAACETYFVFGGVPYYLSFYNPNHSLAWNIKRNVLTKGINLYDEPLVLLRQEFRESRTYRLIIRYLSQGYQSIGKLCSATGMDKSNISKYLWTLQETGMVEHVLPMGRQRGGIYEIADPFFDFWFRYVYPKRAELELHNIDVVLQDFHKTNTVYNGHRFERMVRQLIRSRQIKGLEDYVQVQKWWHKDNELDVVAIGPNKKKVLFCECKWQKNINAEAILAELKQKTELLKWDKDTMEYSYAVFARTFRKRTEECHCFDLNDLAKTLQS